ncbi:uncharacterized protein LOC9315150 [Arabidopsis lyrata subsp. lyrata]|nr:uncharacterized protein LOC9315150 [Arabidopsis lyrata subsp. lyrata]|eukprot:XP_002880908.2 uncharacterized protein LOC9315150 [Arabidopsis lyrata subsp. lyrata]
MVVNLGHVKIDTTIATTEEEINEGIQALLSNTSNHNRLIGLDMITFRVAPEPSSTSGKPSNAAILQLYDSTQCLIIWLHSLHDVPESLYNFLILPAFTFAGFGIKDTIASLKKDYGYVCKNVLEVGRAVWTSYKCDTQLLRDEFVYMRIPQVSSISKPWGSSFELTEDEIKLAVSNAFYAFRIAKILLNIR